MEAMIEHVNVTVSDVSVTEQRYARLFGWHTRWKGDAKDGGTTAHVGTGDSYIAFYQPTFQSPGSDDNYHTSGAMNHIGVVVDDLDATEARIKAEGIDTINHANYEPGRRFYFIDPDGFEVEVISYN